MNNEINNFYKAYFYVKSPDLAFNTPKCEDTFSDSCTVFCEYCEDTTAYDY